MNNPDIYVMPPAGNRDSLLTPPTGTELAWSMDSSRSTGGNAYVWVFGNGKWSTESYFMGLIDQKDQDSDASAVVITQRILKPGD